MSPRIRGHRPDKTHDEVVKAFKSVGCSVVPLVSTGGSPERRGLPDLLVGFRGETWLYEVKDEDGKLRPSQIEWARSWRGAPPLVVRSAHEALSSLGIIAERIERNDGAINESRPGTKPGRGRSLAFIQSSLAARQGDEPPHDGEDSNAGEDEQGEDCHPGE